MKINNIFLILLCLASVGFSLTYEVGYISHMTVDGYSDGWESMPKQYLTAVPAGTESKDYFMLSYKVENLNTKTEKTMLCGYFWMADVPNNAALDYLSVYNTKVDSEHPVLKFGRNARIYDSTGNAITLSDEFQYKKVEATGGWQGEFCVPFSYLSFTTTSDTISGAIVRYSNNNAAQSIWPFGIGSIGELYSKDHWKIPETGGCTEDSQCKDSEYCAIAKAGNACTPVVAASDCGYVANHKWNEHQCCSEKDCPYGTNCVNNVCKAGDECSTDKSCAADEYCAAAATGNKCVKVTGTCGYVADHKWISYECCVNDECAANKYCAGNTCVEVETKSCGQIVNHAWESFECCADAGCGKNKICVENKCVDSAPKQAYCSGKIGLNVYYYDKLNKLMAAEIVGLENCDGNVVFVRKDSCTGGAACAFNIGSNGNNCTFSIPNQPGVYKYVACVNIDGDTSYGPNETDSVIVEITPEECKSTGCTPKTWGPCICSEDSKTGYKTGVCIDNCLNKLSYDMECSCGEEVREAVEETKPVEPPAQVIKEPETPAIMAPPKVPIEYWQIAAVIAILAIPIVLHFVTKEKA